MPYVHINELDNSTYYSNLYKSTGKPSNLRDSEYKQNQKLVNTLGEYGISASASEPIDQILNKFKLIDLNHSSVYYKFTSYYNRPHFKYDGLKTKPVTIRIEATNSVSNDCIRSVYLKCNSESGNYIGKVNYISSGSLKSSKFEYVNLYDVEHKQVLFDFSTLVVSDSSLSNISWSELNDFSSSGNPKVTWSTFTDTDSSEVTDISSVSETDLTKLYFAEDTVYNVVFECMPKFNIAKTKGVLYDSINLTGSNLSKFSVSQILGKFDANDIDDLQTTDNIDEAYLTLTRMGNDMLIYLHKPVKYNLGNLQYKYNLTVLSSDATMSELVGEGLIINANSLTVINMSLNFSGAINSCTTLINCECTNNITSNGPCIHAYNCKISNININSPEPNVSLTHANFYNCAITNTVYLKSSDVKFEYCQFVGSHVSRYKSEPVTSIAEFNNCVAFNTEIDDKFNINSETNFVV